MGPQGFKKMDKRHYHVKDIGDVIEWYAYRESRDQEALKVIKSLRNSHNTQASMIKSYQMRDARNAERAQAMSDTPLDSGAPGTLGTVNQPTESAQDEAIISELKEVLDTEKEVAREVEGEQAMTETGDVDTGEYSVFYVKDSPRFKKGNIMVKSADVPEQIREALTAEKAAEKAGGES